MLSGLILLVIVGAWLAVLVPMALRSHDTSAAMSSVTRFNDAMRVLSRREQTGRGSTRSVVMPSAPAAATTARPAVPVAVRRRRVLVTLVALTLLSLAAALLASTWALAAFVVLAALTVAYVVHLRRLAIRKEELAIRAAARPTAPRSASTWASADPTRELQRIAGIPDRMPHRPLQLRAPLPAPASRYEDPQPVAATWDAVQFPVPTYVTAPAAPPRQPRVLDLTRPGEWSAGQELEDVGLGILDEEVDDELGDILDGRRASGDW